MRGWIGLMVLLAATTSHAQEQDTACWIQWADQFYPCHLDDDGDGVPNLEDCRPDDPEGGPQAEQLATSIDTNCDGQVPAPLECGRTGYALLFLPGLMAFRRRRT